jgi:uncharacterized protein YjlB
VRQRAILCNSENLCHGSKAEHAQALAAIPQVPPPEADPVFGPEGPLLALWRA